MVPLGKEAESGVTQSELLHNEFVVFDPAQVRARKWTSCVVNRVLWPPGGGTDSDALLGESAAHQQGAEQGD